MFRGIFALFFRSLRSDARTMTTHVLRCLLLVVIYLAMCVVQSEGDRFGAPGLLFFRSVIFADAGLITLLGISYFSSAITEEKEEGTLGLMTMAGLSPLGILLGKSTTRLFQVMLLLFVQFPFTLLAITLGGLVSDQIFGAYLALLAYTILLANVGLFFSVVCYSSRSAAGLTTLLMFGYVVAPVFGEWFRDYLQNPPKGLLHQIVTTLLELFRPAIPWLTESNLFVELNSLTQTGHEFGLTTQMITNSVAGLILFLLSWWFFGLVSLDPAFESPTRAGIPQRARAQRRSRVRRAWNRAIVWKDFHFVSGGWFGIVSRSGLYVGLYWLAFAATYSRWMPIHLQTVHWPEVTWAYQVFVVPLFLVDCTLCLSRIFHEELQQQTLASLLILPHSVSYIVYSKLCGCLIGLLPGLIAIVAAFCCLQDDRSSLVLNLNEPYYWWFVANGLLCMHFSVTLSTYLRWGAFVLSVALTIGSMVFMGVGARVMLGGIDPAQIWIFLTGYTLLACVGCHCLVLSRLPALGEK